MIFREFKCTVNTHLPDLAKPYQLFTVRRNDQMCMVPLFSVVWLPRCHALIHRICLFPQETSNPGVRGGKTGREVGTGDGSDSALWPCTKGNAKRSPLEARRHVLIKYPHLHTEAQMHPPPTDVCAGSSFRQDGSSAAPQTPLTQGPIS